MKGIMNKAQEYREALLQVAIDILDILEKEKSVEKAYKDKLMLLYDYIEEVIGLRDGK